MKLNKNGILARFYKWNYGAKLPQNLCPFFWKLALGLIIFPITVWSLLWERVDKSFETGVNVLGGFRFITGLTTLIISALVVLIVVLAVTQPLFFVSVIAAAAILFAILWCVIERRFPFVREIYDFLRESFRAFEGKYCPRLEWN